MDTNTREVKCAECECDLRVKDCEHLQRHITIHTHRELNNMEMRGKGIYLL